MPEQKHAVPASEPDWRVQLNCRTLRYTSVTRLTPGPRCVRSAIGRPLTDVVGPNVAASIIRAMGTAAKEGAPVNVRAPLQTERGMQWYDIAVHPPHGRICTMVLSVVHVVSEVVG